MRESIACLTSANYYCDTKKMELYPLKQINIIIVNKLLKCNLYICNGSYDCKLPSLFVGSVINNIYV